MSTPTEAEQNREPVRDVGPVNIPRPEPDLEDAVVSALRSDPAAQKMAPPESVSVPAQEQVPVRSAVDAGGPPSGPPVDAAGPPSTPPIPSRLLLFKLKRTQVYAGLLGPDSQPWHLPVNGLVLPVGVSAGLEGNLARALRRELGEASWPRLRDLIKQRTSGRVDPYAPVHIAVDDPELGPALLPNAPPLPPQAGQDPNQVPPRYCLIAATVGSLVDVQDVQQVTTAVVQLAAGECVSRLAMPTLGTGTGPFKDQGPRVAEYMVRAVHDALSALPAGALAEITLTTREQPTFEAMQVKANLLVNSLPQRLISDQPAGPDLLDLQSEAGALAKALLVQNVEPPLAVGILGGWGSGKTFVMKLMQQRMHDIRSTASPGWPADLAGRPDTPYVGHIYLIEFNAWTYAKSNLWASLMQTIFFGLSRQLTLESQLAEALAEARLQQERPAAPATPAVDWEARKAELKRVALLAESDLWLALYAAGDEARRLLLQTEVGRAVLAKWQAGEVAADALWEHLQDRTRQESQVLEDLRDELAQTCQQLNRQIEKEVVWAPTLAKLQAVLADSVWKDLKAQLGEDETKTLAGLYKLAPDLASTLKAIRQHPAETLALLAFALVVVAAPWLLGQVVWRVPGVILSAATLAAGYGRVALRLQRTLATICDEYKAGLEAERARLKAGERPLVESKQVKDLRQKVADLEAQVNRQEQRVGLTSQYRSLDEFVQSRLEEGFYERELGFMHRVECDLRELTDALYIRPDDHYQRLRQKRALFPRGQPRVVLFIDDLDRCPPRRVVEVLEAVQLLLKTELFIVVLGLDTRYVTRALEKAYAGILTAEGEPSGLDYIEKILTLPYRVRPVREGAVAHFLSQQLEVRAEEATPPPASGPGAERRGREAGGPGEEPGRGPGEPAARLDLPPPVITFTPDEYEAIQAVCQRVQLTPRALKRIGNVMKLVKIFWHEADMPSPVQAVRTAAALLALSARYPEVMRDAFVELDVRYRLPPGASDGLSPTWHAFFQAFVEENAARNLYVQAWRKDLLADVAATLPEAVTLGDLDVRTFNLARSFSFVGDPTPTFEPPMKVEVVEGVQRA